MSFLAAAYILLAAGGLALGWTGDPQLRTACGSTVIASLFLGLMLAFGALA